MNEFKIGLGIAVAFVAVTGLALGYGALPRGQVVVRSELLGAQVRELRLGEGERSIARFYGDALGPGDRTFREFGPFEPDHAVHLEFEVTANGRSVRLRSRDTFEFSRREDLVIVLDDQFPVTNRALQRVDDG